jgi:hypothetical protein
MNMTVGNRVLSLLPLEKVAVNAAQRREQTDEVPIVKLLIILSVTLRERQGPHPPSAAVSLLQREKVVKSAATRNWVMAGKFARDAGSDACSCVTDDIGPAQAAF